MTKLTNLGESQISAFVPAESPPFGHALLHYFQFEPGFVNLNIGTHERLKRFTGLYNVFSGSEGALPIPVQLACNALERQAEESPDKWKKVIREPLTEATRQRLAPLLGASPDELVFVTTTSHSIDMVLSNFEWCSEDTIVYRGLSTHPAFQLMS